jgi:hypothetical protein
MASHVLVCPCGLRDEIDGWLDALELRRLHNRQPGHEAVIELYTREPK